ncbi:hypothetical protein [Nocardioides sp. SR21]|nr:hypothetical protein [Nocardioides sp. SR21]
MRRRGFGEDSGAAIVTGGLIVGSLLCLLGHVLRVVDDQLADFD